MSDSITMREAWRLDIEELKAERDEARIQYRSTLALAEALAKTQIELKKERDEAREAFAVATSNCVDAQQRLREMEDQRDFATSEIERLRRERDEARKALALVAEDCEAWLNSESDEPSMEFIKAVRDYARKAI